MNWGRGLAFLAGVVTGWPVLHVLVAYRPGAWPLLAMLVGGVVPGVVAGLVTSDLLPPRWGLPPSRSPAATGLWAAGVSTLTFFAARAYLVASDVVAYRYGDRLVEGVPAIFGIEFVITLPGVGVATVVGFVLAHRVAVAADRQAARW